MARKKKTGNNRRANRLQGIKQGAGAVTVKAFGSDRSRSLRGCWDAFHPNHLALPRAVAPYVTVRTTTIWNPTTDDQRRLNIFGPHAYISGTGEGDTWSNAYCMGANLPLTSLRNATSASRKYCFPSMNTSSWAAASVTPAAFSIQVMNPEALQTSTGMVYIGRVKNKLNLAEGDLSSSWQDLADNLVAYSNPRICSAGKLALRGVQVDAVPGNMNKLADFSTLDRMGNATFTMTTGEPLHFEGFNPIFVYNPNAIDLQILVCCEWRVRFDPSNVAYAACEAHRPSTDNTWHAMMTKALALGNGVIDIAERVAEYGQYAGPALRLAQRAAPLMLTA